MNGITVSIITDLICLSIDNAGLSEISLPDNPALQELSLTDNRFSEFDLARYPDLRMLSLSGNQFESLDLSGLNSLQTAAVGRNPMSRLTLDNPQLWGLSAESCRLTMLDLSKVPIMSQLYLSENLFQSIDLSSLAQLQALDISQNAFTFPTLPLRNANWAIYYSANQALLAPELSDSNQVDLSYNSPAADGTPTVYEWYVGYPTYDDEGNIITVPFDEDAYTVEDGVTTFVEGGTDLVCYMTNPAFENIVMYTEPLRVSAVDSVVSEADISVSAGEGSVTVRCLSEIEVTLYAFDGTAAGRSVVRNGSARFDGLAQGVYILVTPAGSYKLHVK